MNCELLMIDSYLFLKYRPEYFSFSYDLEHKTKKIKNTFYVNNELYKKSSELLTSLDCDEHISDEEFIFLLGEIEGNFYKIDKDVLDIAFELYFDKSIKLDISFFVKSNIGYGYSIFSGFDDVYVGSKLYILSEKNKEDIIDNTLSLEQLKHCIGMIPTSHEIHLYRQSRYTSALINYLEVRDKESEYKKYIKKKHKSQLSANTFIDDFTEIDKHKYITCLKKLNEMLSSQNSFEDDWQIEILKIFKLLNPKYIYVGEKIHLNSFVTNGDLYPDIVLVDNDGNIDLIEIKSPKYDEIFYKTDYRGNFVPIRELQGACMQLQNYLISLTKMPEDNINQKKFKNQTGIPIEFKLKSNSSKGYIIYGRDKQLFDNEKMKEDFQIVRNMYANVIDIITYDDLVRRLKNMIDALS